MTPDGKRQWSEVTTEDLIATIGNARPGVDVLWFEGACIELGSRCGAKAWQDHAPIAVRRAYSCPFLSHLVNG